MASIKLLTPLHIGSGNILSSGVDYFFDNGHIHLFDESKVLSVIGESRIKDWVSIIESKGEIIPFIKNIKGNIVASELSRRSLKATGISSGSKLTLREFVHTGNKAYLPGSSLKGGLRTAIFAALVKREQPIMNSNRPMNGGILEGKVFGGNPNEDALRFLKISDAHFNNETIATECGVYNYSGSAEWAFKRENFALLECLPVGASAVVQISVDPNGLRNMQGIRSFIPSMLSTQNIAEMVKACTDRLIERELEFWEGDDYDMEGILDDYKDKLKEIQQESANCKIGECVLRIGFGSGWKAMTGGWIDELYKNSAMPDDEYFNLVDAIRRKQYNGIDFFPKTRKLLRTGLPLGFVKLTF